MSCTILILHDLLPPTHPTHLHLRHKMQTQQQGKLRWLSSRHTFLSSSTHPFLPIEFINDMETRVNCPEFFTITEQVRQRVLAMENAPLSIKGDANFLLLVVGSLGSEASLKLFTRHYRAIMESVKRFPETEKKLMQLLTFFRSWPIEDMLEKDLNMLQVLPKCNFMHLLTDEGFKQLCGHHPLNEVKKQVVQRLAKDEELLSMEALPVALQKDVDFYKILLQYREDVTIPVRVLGSDQSLLFLAIKAKNLLHPKRISAVKRWMSPEEISKLKSDKIFIMELIQYHPQSLSYASKSLRNDRDVVLHAVSRDGLTLIHASNTLQKDREVVCAAVRQNGQVFDQLSFWKDDREILSLALRTYPKALSTASNEMKRDKSLVLEGFRYHPQVVEYASSIFKQDKSFILSWLKELKDDTSDFSVWSGISLELQRDESFMMEMLRTCGILLKYFSFHWSHFKSVSDQMVRCAIIQNEKAMIYARSFRMDVMFVMEMIKHNASVVKYCDERVFGEECIALVAVKQDGCLLKKVPDRLRKELRAESVLQNGFYLKNDVDVKSRHELFKMRMERMYDGAYLGLEI